MMSTLPTSGYGGLPPVLFEDATLIAFDKPAGLPVAPDRWQPERPCLCRLVHTFGDPTWFNVHRIDAETSGVVLFAKNKPSLTSLTRQFETRTVGKIYLAITDRVPPRREFAVNCALGKDPARPGCMRPVAAGAPAAVTHFRVKSSWRHYALVEAQPLTGRTHQIRVHLAQVGVPIVGDGLYGDGEGLRLSQIKPDYKPSRRHPERPLIDRLALHAAELTVQHPETGAPVRISAPLPNDFSRAVKYLDRFDNG